MKRGSIILAAVVSMLSIATPGCVNAQTTPQPYIDINTSVERKVTPNELFLKIVINESTYKGKKTLEEMQEAMLGALKENRVDIPECLTLNYMGSDISYKAFSNKIKPKTEATYMLKLYDVATMQNIIASLEKRQISNIELVKTNYTKENELKMEMGIEAMQQAQSEAKVLAGAIGQEIGKAMSISSYMNSIGASQPRMYKSRNADIDYAVLNESVIAAPEFSIGKTTYTFNVNVRFELK